MLTLIDLTDEGDVVVHQALHAGHRCGFVDEIGEGHLDVARIRFQLFGHLDHHVLERLDRDLAFMVVEDLHEA